MAPVDTAAEIVHENLRLTRAVAWMADWGAYIDEPDYQDPEVAVADGYGGIPLPPAALSSIGLALDILPVADIDAGRVEWTWETAAPVVVGTSLRVHVRARNGCVLASFATADGLTVVSERFGIVEEAAHDDGGACVVGSRFLTGPIDLSRLRALSWGLGQLDPARAWAWGKEPEPLRLLAHRLVVPALVAGRAVVVGEHAPRRIASITVRPGADRAPLGLPFRAQVVDHERTNATVTVRAGGTLVATAAVVLRDGQ